MTPEQWARVERLYHAADTQPRGERLEWLARECNGDEVVRREVESLLAQHASSDDLLESSALSHLSAAVDAGESLIGQRVGGFEIVALLDEGGMGQVYRARDLTLPRDVAAKVIPPALAHDPARRSRFRQEAELLASLFAPDYRSSQPLHPSRGFRGSSQVLENWSSVFEGVPDFDPELVALSVDGDTEWGEWTWHGHHADGSLFAMRGVTILVVRDGLITEGRLYMEPVDVGGGGIDAAVQELYRPPSGPPR